MTMTKLDLEKTLKDYVDGRIDFVSQMNVFMNDRAKDYYLELGKYFVNAFEKSGKTPPQYIHVPKEKNILRHLFNFNTQREYTSAAIFFLTSMIDLHFLKHAFGEPLYHDEFGEGFDKDMGVDKKHRRKSFLSYFVEIDGVKFHIGLDHRGTTFEIEKGTPAEKALSALKLLADKYVESL